MWVSEIQPAACIVIRQETIRAGNIGVKLIAAIRCQNRQALKNMLKNTLWVDWERRAEYGLRRRTAHTNQGKQLR